MTQIALIPSERVPAVDTGSHCLLALAVSHGGYNWFICSEEEERSFEMPPRPLALDDDVRKEQSGWLRL